jgi:hypothetical protein
MQKTCCLFCCWLFMQGRCLITAKNSPSMSKFISLPFFLLLLFFSSWQTWQCLSTRFIDFVMSELCVFCFVHLNSIFMIFGWRYVVFSWIFLIVSSMSIFVYMVDWLIKAILFCGFFDLKNSCFIRSEVTWFVKAYDIASAVLFSLSSTIITVFRKLSNSSYRVK